MGNDSILLENEDLYPPEPVKPLESECCGTGCSPCVFDIYEKQVGRWKKQCDIIRQGGNVDNQNKEEEHEAFICVDQYKEIQIIDIIQETPTCKIFRLTWPSAITGATNDFPVSLGQHVAIKCGGISKQYTILTTNKDDAVFEILIKIYEQKPENGAAMVMITPVLDRLRPNDSLEIRGPFGIPFEYKPNQFSHLVGFVAGTGIAPIYRIIESILENEKDETRVTLLYSCHSMEDIPLIGKLKEWSSFWNFNVTYFVPNAEQERLAYYRMNLVNRRLDLDQIGKVIDKYMLKIDNSLFIICGTKSFEKDVINHLSKLEVSTDRMKLF